MNTVATQPQTISKTLDTSFKLYFSGLKKVYLLSLVIAILVEVPNLLINPAISEDPTQVDLSWLGTFFMWLIPFYLLYFTLGTAMYERLAFLNTPDQPSLGECLADGLKGLLPVCLATLMYGLTFLLGTVLLIIPGIYLGLALILYWPAIILEGRGPLEALKHSYQLVRGNWFRTLAVVSVPTIAYFLVAIIPGFLAGFAVLYDSGTSVETTLNSGTLSFLPFITVPLYAAIYPLYFAVTISLLRDLTLRKQGSDLEARLEWNESSI